MAKQRKDNIFTNVLFPSVKTNKFDLSHDVKMSFQMGELVPTCVMECLPGDQVEISTANMLRFAPLVSPVMHRVKCTTHYFFVANRLLWDGWQDFITGNSDDTPPYTEFGPHGITNMEVGSLADYLGIPPAPHSGPGYIQRHNVSLLQVAAYMKVWDEYYRDQNLQTEKFIPLTPGQQTTYDAYLTSSPLFRAWQHDYFTSCLPFAQKGDSVQIPLTQSQKLPVEVTQYNPTVWQKLNGSPAGAGTVANAAGPTPYANSTHVGTDPAIYDPNGTLTVDVQADATDINTLRRAFRLQEWLEKNARGGTRYIESILAHFGVTSSDARLQRPEYIGGDVQMMTISEVLATAQSDNNATEAEISVGHMAGHGISVGGGNRFNYRCEEHGFIIGIINVQPDTAYQDGLHKSFSRLDRLDYAWPTFANIGEQEVQLRELQMNTSNIYPAESLFGYIPRYAEYKYLNSRVAGDMRTNLAFWHLGRIFDNPDGPPQLNEEFIECLPSTRIFAVTDENEDHIWSHIFNNITVRRKLPRYGIPQI